MLKVPTLLRVAQFVFWSATIFTFVCAVLPYEHTIHIFKWDKAEHFLAFYVLTGLAVAAFPRANLFIIAAALSGFGAFIEFVQGLSWVGRDRDFQDWVTDTIAIGMAHAADARRLVAQAIRRAEHAVVLADFSVRR